MLANGIVGWATPAQNRWRDTVTTPAPIYLPFVAKNYMAPAPLWRFGAAKARRPLEDYIQTDPNQIIGLRLGWYVDWTVAMNAPEPYGMEYVPIVRLKQWKLQDGSTWTTCCVECPYVQVNGQYTYTVSPDLNMIRSIAVARPGKLWVIGNEIERVDWATGSGYCNRQDEMLPEVYAEAYHDIRQAILDADSTARFAIGGVIQATPLRLEYLNRIWNAYQQKYGTEMPVDVWNVHAFVLREEKGSWGADIPAGINATQGQLYEVLDNRNFAIAWGHIRAMRDWMRAKGRQNKPLIITEYGVNMPPHFEGFSPEEVRDHFMYLSFNSFLNQTDTNLGYSADGYRLVQRWNWYSLDDDSGYYEGNQYRQFYNGNLLYSDLGGQPQGLSPLGVYWQQYVQALPPASEPPYVLTTRLPRIDNEESQWSVAPVSEQADAHCDGRRIRLVFVEPAPSGASLAGITTEKPVGSVIREERICLPSADQ